MNEHALHLWDVEVVDDPAATLPQQAAEIVVDGRELIARFTGRPTGDTTTITVATADPGRVFPVATAAPARVFAVALDPDSARFGPASDATWVDFQLPAEAFARLVYGRLDP